MSASARLWLVRHGQTDWNLQQRTQGHTPTELNAAGREQARQLAGMLADKPFAAVWSSDLPRASQTAEILAVPHGLPVQTTPELRERNLGSFEGKTWEEVRTIRSDLAGGVPPRGDLADWTGVPGVESDEAVWARIAAVLRRLSDQYAGKDVLVVTHGGVMKHALCQILGIPAHTPRRFPLSNGLLAVVQWRTEYFYMLSLVDMNLILHGQEDIDTATTLPKAG